MAWWNRENRLETKTSAAGPIISYGHVGRPAWTKRAYEQLADEAYVRNAVAYRCVKTIATAAAAAPWLLTGRNRELIDEHPLLGLLERPAPVVGGSSLFEAFFSYLLISGNGYMEAVGPSDTAPPKELWPKRSDRMTVIPGPYGIPEAYEYKVGGRPVRWESDPVTGQSAILHVKEFHPTDDWYGLSRIDPAAYGVDRHNAASAHNKALLDNGARPSGILVLNPDKKTDGTLNPAPKGAIDAARKELDDRHIGAKNAGTTMVMGGLLEWLEMGVNPRDMDFAKGKEDAARDICVAIGVPHILIVPGSSTYNNMREAKLELWEDTILPLLKLEADALNAWLVPRFGDGLQLSHDLDKISALEHRRETKRRSVSELLEAGVIDTDEARQELQYDPRADEVVKKVDAQVLKVLVEAAGGDIALFQPLFRYLRSVGLLEPGATIESVMEEATRLLANLDEEDSSPEEETSPDA